MKCADLLFDHIEDGTICDDPNHRAALARRADGGTAWSPIVRGTDGGGARDFLDGRPIYCGAVLELQAIESREDDYGSFRVNLPSGAPVRYEVAGGIHGTVMLYGGIAGHDFIAEHHAGMRFRWPQRD